MILSPSSADSSPVIGRAGGVVSVLMKRTNEGGHCPVCPYSLVDLFVRARARDLQLAASLKDGVIPAVKWTALQDLHSALACSYGRICLLSLSIL